MKKEILTKELIDKEISLKKRKHLGIQIELLIPLSIYLLYYLFGVVIQVDFSQIKSIVELIFFTVIGVIFIVVYIHKLFYYRKKEAYELSFKRMDHKFHDLLRYDYFQTNNKIYFDSKMFCNHPGIYCMNIDDVTAFNEAEVGDYFYVVVEGKKALCAFNSKYFELDEELQKELRT